MLINIKNIIKRKEELLKYNNNLQSIIHDDKARLKVVMDALESLEEEQMRWQKQVEIYRS